MKKILSSKRSVVPEAWHPVPYEIPDAAAFQALERGEASPEQQMRALRWMIEQGAGTYDLSYRPASDRDTAFAEGRRFVGLQIVKLMKLNLRTLR